MQVTITTDGKTTTTAELYLSQAHRDGVTLAINDKYSDAIILNVELSTGQMRLLRDVLDNKLTLAAQLSAQHTTHTSA